jgi:hypothetical protein
LFRRDLQVTRLSGWYAAEVDIVHSSQCDQIVEEISLFHFWHTFVGKVPKQIHRGTKIS